MHGLFVKAFVVGVYELVGVGCLLHWLSLALLYGGNHLGVLHVLQLVHLSYSFGLQEIHFKQSLVRLIVLDLLLFVEYQIIQVYFITSYLNFVLAGERLQVLHSVSAEHHVSNVLNHIICEVLLLRRWASICSPWLAQEGLVGGQGPSGLIWI